MDIREVKHRLRRLKRQEEILWEYAGHSPVEDVSLIWELFFSLRESKGGNSKEKAKYPLAELLNMDENAFQSVMEEYARFLYAAILPEDRKAFPGIGQADASGSGRRSGSFHRIDGMV